MKRSKLYLLGLFSLASLFLSSCAANSNYSYPYIGDNGNWYINGEDSGIKATGENGKDGADGKDGVDGKDGTNGKDGSDGKDGADGKDGTDGKDGETTYSCSFANGMGGYAYCDKGSAKVGEDVTFTFVPEKLYIIDSITINGTEYEVSDLTSNDDGTYSLTLTMVENGFMVLSRFRYYEDFYVYSEKDIIEAINDEDVECIYFESDLEVGDEFITAFNALDADSGDKKFYLQGNNLTVNADKASDGYLRRLNVKSFVHIDGEGGTIDIKNTSDTKYGIESIGGNKKPDATSFNAFEVYEGGELEICDTTINSEISGIGLYSSSSEDTDNNPKLYIKNSKISAHGGISTNATNPSYYCYINILDSTIEALGYNDGLGSNTSDGDGCGILINVENAKLDVSNSTITGGRQGMFVRCGTATICNNSTIKSTGEWVNLNSSDKEKYFESTWGGGNEAPSADLVIGNNTTGKAYQYKASVTLDDYSSLAGENTKIFMGGGYASTSSDVYSYLEITNDSNNTSADTVKSNVKTVGSSWKYKYKSNEVKGS